MFISRYLHALRMKTQDIISHFIQLRSSSITANHWEGVNVNSTFLCGCKRLFLSPFLGGCLYVFLFYVVFFPRVHILGKAWSIMRLLAVISYWHPGRCALGKQEDISQANPPMHLASLIDIISGESITASIITSTTRKDENNCSNES